MSMAPTCGIIPAGAGKSVAPWRHPDRRRDHPRGCGEKWTPMPWPVDSRGSSPRVRGKGPGDCSRSRERGIIPAGAGKSRPRGRPHPADRDHPRGCGEKRPIETIDSPTNGSSPRVRGKGNAETAILATPGIIPAGAGKSSLPEGRTFSAKDHPRGCGEKVFPFADSLAYLGSSPRVRGKGRLVVIGKLLDRIIPAGAGKSCRMVSMAVSPRDHPRGCGEKHSASRSWSMVAGSSPRVRGKDLPGEDAGRAIGIIPAGAGKRSSSLVWSRPAGDHPRGCGEKGPEDRRELCTKGSSPRVRGKE